MKPVPVRLRLIVQGQMGLCHHPEEGLTTVLGSCVAACVWDPLSGLGGMNHFLLPTRPTEAPESAGAPGLGYGEEAMPALIAALLSAGAVQSRLHAKLFGGARIVPGLRDIGKSNADYARKSLKALDIPCIAESLGGTRARRVTFHPASGRARQWLVPDADLLLASAKPSEESRQ